jgi:hypothetical protein
MKRDMLELSFSCGEDFESMERRGGARHCASCDHAVHDLSSMTEREATAFLARHQDAELCVRYLSDEDGAPLFMPEPSRGLRLLRQVDGVQRLAAAALVAAPLLLTACDEEPVGHAQAQAPLVLRDGQPVSLQPGAASAPTAPLSAEEQELARWRAELRAKQEARDTWRAQLAARQRAKQEAQALKDEELRAARAQRVAQAVASYRGELILMGRLDRTARSRQVSRAHVQGIADEAGQR